MKCILFIGLLFFCLPQMNGQSDIVTWSSARLDIDGPDDFDFAIRPIVRHNENLSNYNDISLDISMSKEFDSGISFQFLNRYWWIQEGPNRNFWFWDISYAFNATEKFEISNTFRWHIAQDIKSDDPNFLRHHLTMAYDIKSDFSIKLGSETFFRIDGINEVQRFRFVTGFAWDISELIEFKLTYWRESDVNIGTRVNHVFLPMIEFNI